VELVHAQLKRPKGRVDAPDLKLYNDLSTILSHKNDTDIDLKILARLSKKLLLKTIADLKKESHALYMMVIERGDDDDSESLKQISGILRKLKEFALTENLEMNEPDNENDTSCGRASIEKIIPDDFRCPISLELMKDPVIVATGQIFSGILEEQRAVAGELRLLAKRNGNNIIYIAEAGAGAIPPLIKLLSTQDQRTQEHAVTALLNLSIHDGNKRTIVMAGAVPPIVEILKSGSMEARENAAATLFNLSFPNEHNVTIGKSGAIPTLVDLLRDGNQRGKKDAVNAFFHLRVYQGNKVRALRADILTPLMELLVDSNVGM
ncbi:hypothetical protein KI387_018339, partial [Taxus chinensis]